MGLLAGVAPLECVWSQWKHIMIIIAFLRKPNRSVMNVQKWLPSTAVLSAAILTQTYSKLSSFHLRNSAMKPCSPYRRERFKNSSAEKMFLPPCQRLRQVSLCMLASRFWLHERERRIDSNMCVAVDVVNDRPESQVCIKRANDGVCWQDAVWPWTASVKAGCSCCL